MASHPLEFASPKPAHADIGIDLGTCNLLVYLKGRGIVLREPSVVAVAGGKRQIVAVGEEARQMIGRAPAGIEVIRPLSDGVIAEYTVTERLLRHLLDRVWPRRRIVGPTVVICLPSGATSVERRAVLEAATSAGARKAIPVEEPMAAAIGAGLPVTSPQGSMVIDIGGGTTDIAVISLGGIVVSDSARVAGDEMDQVILRHLRRAHNLMVGDRTAEEIKIAIGSAHPTGAELSMEVRGRDALNGLPRSVQVSSQEIRSALREPLEAIISRIKTILEQTPPELAADIIQHGITLTGGGALLRGIDRLIELETGLATHLAEDPLSCVAIGTGKYLEITGRLPVGNWLSSLARYQGGE